MFFQFEADFVNNLRCIPMQVRYKLDTCGVKLKLHHWHQFSQAEREELVNQPCETPDQIQIYKQNLQNLVLQHTDEPAKELELDPHPPWLNPEVVPQQLEEKASDFKVTITLEQWQQLSPLQRFALIKLSRPSHENKNFYPALKEFGIIEP
ncbi:nitrate reductase associated protein [Halothece sp. PCC 7418]|uniref:nitrate reductase associated protein n=1 Tax=Halothece sp. (strain PCC 7418) TaxID=65093 RepID=UPI00030CED7D|nr:nitrate reductase associated protein [Halothece sp. PCC 7418]